MVLSEQLAVEGQLQRLWTASDGTICVLTTGDTPPYYSIALVRNEQVLRQRRLYGLASARMIAQAWKERG